MKDVNKLFASMAKSYGDKGIYKASELPDYDVVSTGSLSTDYALSIGGLPLGRLVEVGGANGAGKTLFSMHTANNYLNRYPDDVVAFLDLEHRLEREWMRNFIGDMDRVFVLKPDSVEEGSDMLKDLAQSNLMRLAVWDSIGGAPAAAELEKSATKQQFGGNSKAITALSKHATVLASKHNFTFLGINQIREDMSGYRQYITPGGVAWKHACSLRIQLKRAPKGADGELFEKINGEEVQVGFRTYAKIIKSSVGAPGRVASYWFYNVANSRGFGLDKTEEVVRLSTLTEVVERRGGWHYHEIFPDGKLLGQSKVGDFLRDNTEARDLLFKLTFEKMQSGKIDLSEAIATEDPNLSLEEGPEAPVLTLQEIAAQARVSREKD